MLMNHYYAQNYAIIMWTTLKVIPLKLFLDIVPSSSVDITRVLRGCFGERSVDLYVVLFRFVTKQRKTSIAVGMSSSIF